MSNGRRPKTSFFSVLLADERAQTNVEYVLLLVIAAGFALMLARVLKPAFERLSGALGKRVDQFFGASFHRFPIGR